MFKDLKIFFDANEKKKTNNIEITNLFFLLKNKSYLNKIKSNSKINNIQIGCFYIFNSDISFINNNKYIEIFGDIKFENKKIQKNEYDYKILEKIDCKNIIQIELHKTVLIYIDNKNNLKIIYLDKKNNKKYKNLQNNIIKFCKFYYNSTCFKIYTLTKKGEFYELTIVYKNNGIAIKKKINISEKLKNVLFNDMYGNTTTNIIYLLKNGNVYKANFSYYSNNNFMLVNRLKKYEYFANKHINKIFVCVFITFFIGTNGKLYYKDETIKNCFNEINFYTPLSCSYDINNIKQIGTMMLNVQNEYKKIIVFFLDYNGTIYYTENNTTHIEDPTISWNFKEFKKMKELKNVLFMSCSKYHSMFMLSNGDIYGLGENSHNELSPMHKISANYYYKPQLIHKTKN